MKRICKICGNKFEPKSSRRSICYDIHYHDCPVCGKKVITKDLQHLNSCCSKECTVKLRNLTTSMRFDIHPSQSESAKEKRKKTNLERYGVDNVFKIDYIQIDAKKKSNESIKKRQNLIEPLQKICINCGDSFETTNSFEKVCKRCKIAKCKVCGKLFERGWPYTQEICSEECRIFYMRSEGCKERICELCGQSFKPESPRQKYCKRDHYRICEICGFRFKLSDNQSHSRTCSKKCEQKLRENTNLQRFGYENPMKSNKIKQKVSSMFQAKYGSPWYIQSDEFWKQYHESMRKRYGVDWPIQCEDIRNQINNTMTERYGYPWYVLTEEYLSKQPELISSINRAFGRKLSDSGIEYSFEKRFEDVSFDICIESRKLLVEIDPTYTHNVIGNHWNSTGLDKNYHIYKSEVAHRHGYRCIHIFDWDDSDKILNMIQNKTTIFARNCKVEVIDEDTASKFENKYHLQKSCKGQKICYGLYYEDQLIQVMTFGNPRYVKDFDFELLRLCTDTRYMIVGGASRLFHKFLQDHPNGSVVSYCDRSKFEGSVYQKLGMKLLRKTPPAKIWSKGSNRITDNLLRQRGYDQLFNTNYGKGTSNEQLMIEDKWLPVYDCGQLVYVYLPDVESIQ